MYHCKKTYPQYFWPGVSVLELASYNVNGSAREHFKNPKKYVGVDIVPGPGVDVVTPCDKTFFTPGEFDTLICLSLFEHDPGWKNSFSHNLKWVRPGGMIFLCWGAEGNYYHPPDPWAIVPVADFMKAAEEWPIKILDGFFEETRYKNNGASGCYDVVAVKTK